MNLKTILATSVAFGLAIVIAACGNGESKNDSEKQASSKFKFGTVELPVLTGALCGAPFYIAKEKGFFAEEGVDVKFVASDAETRKLGLGKGTYPMYNSDFQFFQSVESGVGIKIVDGIHIGCIKVLVKKGATIKTAADLKGKKIAVDEIGGAPYQVTTLWLGENGISSKPEDGQVTFLPYADGNLAFAALEQGQVDAVAIYDPIGSAYEKAGKVDVLLDIAKDPIFAGKFCCFIYVSAKVLKEEPAKIAALLRALHKASSWVVAHPEEAVDIIGQGKYAEIGDRDLAIQLTKEYAYSVDGTQASVGRDVKRDLHYFAKHLKSVGVLTKDADQFVNDIYAEVDLDLK